MSRSEFSRGTLICIENAEKWMKEAEILAEKGSYGHASALLIHGIEALAQAWICFTLARGSSSMDEKSVKDFFRKHDVKLDFFVANILIHDVGKEFLLNHFKKEDMVKFNILPLINYFDSVKDMVDNKRKNYPKELMEKRNCGIYVDYDYENEKFLSPQDISKEEYLKLKNEADVFETMLSFLIGNPLVK